MVQRIVITGTLDTDADPHVANLWRDDQKLSWILAPGLAWSQPTEEFPWPPVHFLPADETHQAWPGTDPAPVGQLAEPDAPDVREYQADANHPMADLETARYHYRFHVVVMEAVHKIVDPDVENHPEP